MVVPLSRSLLSNRKKIHPPKKCNVAEPGYWWWECVLLVQKCIMTGLLVIIAPGTTLQLFVGFLFAIIYMMLVLRLGPYVGDQEDVALRE